MRRFLVIQKNVVLLLTAFILLLFSGCRTLSTLPRSEIPYAEKQHYYIHGQNISYQVSGTTMSEGTFTGIISNPLDAPSKGQIMHIYVAPDSVVSVINNVVSVPFSNIAKAEIYNVNTGKTILIGAGAANAAFWSVIVIAFLTKDMSCPFIYSEDGADINFEGEAYSGATAVPIERNDYLTLKSIAPVDNQYKIRITNEVREIQNTNLAELLIFDHDADAEVLVDKYGIAHSISAIKKPVTATNAYGRSILSELSNCDSARYISDVRNDKLLFDTIRLSFEKPKHCDRAKLIISSKNTMWLDYMFARFSDLFGSRYDEWVKRRNKRSPEYLTQWTLDQGIPLAVYLETNAGLEFIDYYNVPGPAADKKDVLQFDVSGVSGDRVNVVLVSGVLFWDFDFAGMDFSDDQKIVKTVVSLDYAADETGKVISPLLKYDDDKYLVQPLINNEARLTFKVPPPSPGKDRTVVLHSKGNYEPIRTAEGKPDLELLKGMLKPGMFIKFTKDHFLKYYAVLN